MARVPALSEKIRAERTPVGPDNPFLALEQQVSQQIVAALDAFRIVSERASEETFRAIYGNRMLQAALGIDPESEIRPRKAAKSPLHSAFIERRREELRADIPKGGLREAMIRALLYVGMARGHADERGFNAIRALLRDRSAGETISLAAFKTLLRQQFFMLLIDEAKALAAIPAMLPEDRAKREAAFSALQAIIAAAGPPTDATAARLEKIASLFELNVKELAPLPGKAAPRKAS
jgi:hypothetical protein